MKKTITDNRSAMYLKVLKAEFKDVDDIQAEYRFHPTRRWRFDFAFPSLKLALEIDGGVWTGGRHTHSTGYLNDLEKFNEATSMGWRVLRVACADQYNRKTFDYIRASIDYIQADQKAGKDL